MTPIYGFSSWDGYVVDDPGLYYLCWYNDNLFFSATVYYSVEVFRPSSATVVEPLDGSYVNTSVIDIQGTFDTRAEGVLVGPDALHLRKAAAIGDSWGLDDLVLNEGQNTILVRSYYWLDVYGYGNYTIDKTVHVTVDTIPPDLAIISPVTTPSSGTYLKGLVNVSWQCSDANGIANREVKVDALGWQEVAMDSFTAQLADGQHVIQVRVTDLAGNAATGEITFVSDTVAPEVTMTGPSMNAKISKDSVSVSWSGSDDLSGIDHYEVRITGGDWVNVGNATSYQLTNLRDVWYSVDVKAVDKSGNNATSTVSFGIYTSAWSQSGPYHGIPLFALIAAIIVGAVVVTLLFRRKKGGPAVATVPKEDASPQTQ